MRTQPFLSLIIPAYRKSSIITPQLRQLNSYLGSQKISFEIICVVEDIYSDITYVQALTASARYPRTMSVIGYPDHLGKGFTVRLGFSRAIGKWIGFMDAGSKISLSSLGDALRLAKSGSADIVAASKHHPDSVISRDVYRHAFSFLSQRLTRLLFSLPVSDTLVGLKLIRGSALSRLLPHMHINSYAFDVELLLLAHSLGYRIAAAPVRITYQTGIDSTFTGPKMLKYVGKYQLDLLRLFWRNQTGRLLA